MVEPQVGQAISTIETTQCLEKMDEPLEQQIRQGPHLAFCWDPNPFKQTKPFIENLLEQH